MSYAGILVDTRSKLHQLTCLNDRCSSPAFAGQGFGLPTRLGVKAIESLKTVSRSVALSSNSKADLRTAIISGRTRRNQAEATPDAPKVPSLSVGYQNNIDTFLDEFIVRPTSSDGVRSGPKNPALTFAQSEPVLPIRIEADNRPSSAPAPGPQEL
ncbi:hypothetical protein EJ07DRAFT_154399 [Lizonia empirigonia]|nr:hypothetical protein EJ07DRAFT_154399 [Lizonia empirigonia]